MKNHKFDKRFLGFHIALVIFSLFSGMIVSLFDLVGLAVVLGFPLIFIFPGFLLLGILWPRSKEIESIWRIALVLPTSIALVGLTLLCLTYFWVYQFNIALLLIIFLNLVLIITHLIVGTKFGKNSYLDPILFNKKRLRLSLSIENLILLASALVFLVTIGYTIFSPSKQINFTEFYILNPDRSIPTSINLDDLGRNFILGITNQEDTDLGYSLIVIADYKTGSEVIYYQSSYVYRDETEEIMITLPNLPENTSHVNFLLFKEVSEEPYLSLRLPVE